MRPNYEYLLYAPVFGDKQEVNFTTVACIAAFFLKPCPVQFHQKQKTFFGPIDSAGNF
jgi:hypothetical protein